MVTSRPPFCKKMDILHQDTARYSLSSKEEKFVKLAEPCAAWTIYSARAQPSRKFFEEQFVSLPPQKEN